MSATTTPAPNCPSCAQPGGKPPAPAMQQRDSGCGMNGNAASSLSVTFAGQTFHFCSAYSVPLDASDIASPATAGHEWTCAMHPEIPRARV